MDDTIKRSSVLDGMNEDQIKCIEDIFGPSVCLAGTGAGQTATLIRRTS